jgi:Glutamate decarboxylase and related PLP-dependent proteins
MTERICRHNAMARQVAAQAAEHPNLELVLEPTLSICCFRYVHEKAGDLNALKQNHSSTTDEKWGEYPQYNNGWR